MQGVDNPGLRAPIPQPQDQINAQMHDLMNTDHLRLQLTHQLMQGAAVEERTGRLVGQPISAGLDQPLAAIDCRSCEGPQVLPVLEMLGWCGGQEHTAPVPMAQQVSVQGIGRVLTTPWPDGGVAMAQHQHR